MAGQKIVIIGGVAAGPKAAAKIRRMDTEADITIADKGFFLSYAGCGLRAAGCPTMSQAR